MHGGYLYLKYALDFCAALLAVILLSPLLLLVAAAIKLEDGGEVIFAGGRGRGHLPPKADGAGRQKVLLL